MLILANIVVLLVALLHLYFLILEMFLWDKPLGLKVFSNTLEKARLTQVMAKNQGLYNGFLSAGLLWGLVQGTAGVDFQVFFLGCVIVAGVYGAITVSKKIFWVQGVPGLIGLLLVVLSH